MHVTVAARRYFTSTAEASAISLFNFKTDNRVSISDEVFPSTLRKDLLLQVPCQSDPLSPSAGHVRS